MLGFWITAVAVTLLLALLSAEWYLNRRWPLRAGLGFGALIGGNAIPLTFVGIGVLVEAAMSNAPWLRNDPAALWVILFCLWTIFAFGALRAAPWVAAHTQPPATQTYLGHDSSQ